MSVLGALVGGALSAFGASKQQSASRAMSREQMDFQRKMSVTAHQRQVRDLRKAGLNPILSANQGASSPGGAMGVAQNIAGTGVSKALDTMQAQANVKNVEANTAKTIADTNPANKIESVINSVEEFLGVKKGESRDQVRGLAEKILGFTLPENGTAKGQPDNVVIQKGGQFDWKEHHEGTKEYKSRYKGK